MKLTPWYKIEGLTPREDLRLGKPLDASEFAVHLDHVRLKKAPNDYQDPKRFFERTFLTKYLLELASEVVKRLVGVTVNTNAIFNLSTQFGGGKTHSLTLLYHLATQGAKANSFTGVNKILEKAGINSIPEASVAVFVGTEFDSTTGRGGNDGTPVRKTPWGEIAFQLGGESAFEVVKEHDKNFTVPAGDVIRDFLPKDKPCLILIDEVINYISRHRKQGYNNELYNFLHTLSETVRGLNNVVLVASLPKSEIEYTIEDETDLQRFKKMLDRVGKAIIISAESETAEIIRRRLFEWDTKAISQDGKVVLHTDAVKTCKAYAQWVIEYRQQIPSWFPVDSAEEIFKATYPFHPIVLSVFERKWQSLPSFQRTRGVLRLLALWVSNAYNEGYRHENKDPLISLGTAPLDDPLFRTPCFEQLGSTQLEGAVTTDICGKKDSHAIRLDHEAILDIKKYKLHNKVATTIFFESNGGQNTNNATLPEIRLAVGEPNLEIANIETVLEGLRTSCYYLAVNQTSYRFNIYPNLNKILADKKASIPEERIKEKIHSQIQKVFRNEAGVQVIYFPEKPSNVPNQPVITLVVLSPDYSEVEENAKQLMESIINESGSQTRIYKSAVFFSYVDNANRLRESARRLLAWEDIKNQETRLDDEQKRELQESLSKAERDLKETVWQSYKFLSFLDKNNKLNSLDLGLINSSQSSSLIKLIINRLRSEGEIYNVIAPNFLIKNWSPAFTEWSIKSIRDAFFASPQFPRVLSSDVIKDTISRGVANGFFAYVGKVNEEYKPFIFKENISTSDIQISDDMYLLKAEDANSYVQKITDPPELTSLIINPNNISIKPNTKQSFIVEGKDQYGEKIDIENVNWTTSYGAITSEGLLTVADEKGNYFVTATCQSITAIASFFIRIDQNEDISNNKNDLSNNYSSAKKSLDWHGEITPRNWMQFYSKVLSKFTNNRELELNIKVQFTVNGYLEEQQINEVKSGLQELGLDDDL